MTYEELRAEAERQGYTLIKKQPKIAVLPCICGATRRHDPGVRLWHKTDDGAEFFRCNKCGFSAPSAKSARLAKLAWNESVRHYTNQHEGGNNG